MQSPTPNSIYVWWTYAGDNPLVEYGLTTELGNQVIPEKILIDDGNIQFNWYSAKLENLSHLLLTASTLVWFGRYKSFCSCKLYGGSANIKSTEFSGRELRTSMQLPLIIWLREKFFMKGIIPALDSKDYVVYFPV